MTLEEAIKFNQATERYLRTKEMFLDARALQLGIEALKHVQNARAIGGYGREVTLPGLTEK